MEIKRKEVIKFLMKIDPEKKMVSGWKLFKGSKLELGIGICSVQDRPLLDRRIEKEIKKSPFLAITTVYI